MSAQATTTSSGTSILGLLGIAFVVLKLLGVISWSWVWVVAPFWIPFFVLAFVLFIGAMGIGIRELRHL